MLKLEHRIVGCELRAKGQSDGSEFTCYASAFYTIERSYGTIIDDCAFDETLDFFLREGFIGGLNHNWDKPIGKPLTVAKDKRGIISDGRISATSDGNDAKILIKDEVIKRVSIAFITQGHEWLDTAEDVAAYWQSRSYTPTPDDVAASQYGARLITKLKLYEYSPVTIAANDGADILSVRAGELPDGLTLDNHVLSVLDATKTLSKRLGDVAQKRQAEGRTLSPQRLAQVTQLRADLDSIFASPVLQAQEAREDAPASIAQDEAATAAYLRFLELDSTL